MKELAEEGGIFSSEINDIIVTSQVWKGFTQDDVTRLDTIFETDLPLKNGGEKPPAQDWSLCPICLGYTARGGGCKYMKHDCRKQG